MAFAGNLAKNTFVAIRLNLFIFFVLFSFCPFENANLQDCGKESESNIFEGFLNLPAVVKVAALLGNVRRLSFNTQLTWFDILSN